MQRPRHPLTASPADGGALHRERPDRRGLEVVAVLVGQQHQFDLLCVGPQLFPAYAAVNQDASVYEDGIAR